MTDDLRSKQELVEELKALNRENQRLKQAVAVQTEKDLSKTILVVDDNGETRSIVSTMVEELGYTALTAASAQDAIDRFIKPGLKVDLILSDIVMPEEDGPDMMDQILKIRPDIKVIFMSGYAEDEIVHDSVYKIQDSSAPFMQKPFSLAKLKSLLLGQMNE